MSKILVKAGTYRNEKVVDTAFTLVKGFQTGSLSNKFWNTILWRDD